jgi:uncharacterized protein YjiS (DUF1127 family)
MSDFVISSARHATSPTLGALAAALARTVERITERLAARRTLVELSRLDDHALKDIGWCRTDLAALGWAEDLRAGARGPVRPAPSERR